MTDSKPLREPRFRVAICGGGIAGLILTVALAQYEDIEVHVYEATEKFKEIGAGVTIWGRAWSILARMGLEYDMRLADDIPTDGLHDPNFGYDFRRSDQPEDGFVFKALRLPYVCLPFHRAHFVDVLIRHLPEGAVNFGKRLVTYSESDSGAVELQFSDGTAATCDVLLGCDGIRSVVRKRMFEEEAARQGRPELLKHVEPSFTGATIYRTLVPREELSINEGEIHPASSIPLLYCGKSKHLVAYPIAGGTLCNLVGIVWDTSTEGKQYDGPWFTECGADELVNAFDGWEPQVRDLLKLVHPRKPLKWAIHEVRALPFSVSGNVALVGDAVSDEHNIIYSSEY
ncbi:hypothetical protein NM688_g6883 [Phlebia brevispora]|uniref:Uncharacterized protein n=1 Tax=Phlebia brevispora TaxID=194682 RepID=A0ACC1SBP6_9APHY|nr:hypothetical protein NM688_g6883 [Phlebia brevispora]